MKERVFLDSNFIINEQVKNIKNRFNQIIIEKEFLSLNKLLKHPTTPKKTILSEEGHFQLNYLKVIKEIKNKNLDFVERMKIFFKKIYSPKILKISIENKKEVCLLKIIMNFLIKIRTIFNICIKRF